MGNLTDLKIRTAKPVNKAYTLKDGAGLFSILKAMGLNSGYIAFTEMAYKSVSL